MKAIDILNFAYRYAQILADEGETLETPQIEIGLQHLEDTINDINIEGEIIGYSTYETFNFTPNTEILELQGYVEITSIDYLLGGIRCPLKIQQVGQYFETASITTASSIPVQVWVQKTATGVNAFIYFKPNTNYTVEVVGTKFIPVPTSADFEYDDRFRPYFSYLKWSLARRLRAYRGMQDLPMIGRQLDILHEKLHAIKPVNTEVYTSNLGKCNGSALEKAAKESAEANILRGWRP